MIASLAGTLAEKSPERVVVDVHGVGYLVHVSLQTFADLPAAGGEVRLLVHTRARARRAALEHLGTSRRSDKIDCR